MTQDIQLYEKKIAIVMRGGLTHMVSLETGERVQNALSGQKAHQFMKISELNITINTAEVEGVYTMEQYDELAKVQAGMYKCPYSKWHAKRTTCECRADFLKSQRQAEESRQREAENRPLTEEERVANLERMRLMNEKAALNSGGFWRQMFNVGNRGGRKIRRSTIDAWEKETGQEADLKDLAIEEDVLSSIMD